MDALARAPAGFRGARRGCLPARNKPPAHSLGAEISSEQRSAGRPRRWTWADRCLPGSHPHHHRASAAD
jgi:hypothetical protein